MPWQDPAASFFSATARRPSYLACWHRAFAPAPGRGGPLVEVWFDRGPEAPRCRRLQLPQRGDGQVIRLAGLYLAAVVNNALCLWGARRVSLRCSDQGLADALCDRLHTHLFYQAEILTDLTPLFLYALVGRRYGQRLEVDASAIQAARLAERAAPPRVLAPSSPSGRLTVLAINIGQYKTSWGLVTLDGDSGHTVSRLWRQPTWPDGLPRCYAALAGPVLRHLAERLGPLPPETAAVCLSLATPVLDGHPYAVAHVGLAADCDQDTADALEANLTAAAREAFPGLPVCYVNDACAQGLAAARLDREQPGPTAAGGLLSLRLGACPSVSYLDARGRNLPRLNEYAWLVTRVANPDRESCLLATVSRSLSFHGLGCLAQELGLLEKYRLPPDQAAVFFHRLCLEGSETERHDALALYHVLGAHVAMLADEVHRDTAVGRIRLLGSEANRLDPAVFAAIRSGFTGFVDRYGLSVGPVDFRLLPGVSAEASLVGAAVGYAEAGGRP